MFLPNQTALLIWISRAVLCSLQPAPGTCQPQQATHGRSRENGSLRSLALVAVLAFLFLVLALVLLTAGSDAASTHAAVALPARLP